MSLNDDIPSGIGEAWLRLAAELEQQLREDDPDARVVATLDPVGLLALDVRTTRARRADARVLARRYEERARTMCERCGGRLTTAGAGPVITILCANCSPHA